MYMTGGHSWSQSTRIEIGDDTDVSLGDGHRMACREYGDADGVPVLFLHGIPGSRLLGALFDDEAESAGVRLLAFDRPGFGRSPPWQDPAIRDPGELVTVVLDEFDIESAELIAFSGSSRHAVAAATGQESRLSSVDIVSGATPPSVSEETPGLQRVFFEIATTAPVVLRGLFRAQTWLAGRLDPSFVVSQFTTGDPEGAIPDDTARIVRADFLEALNNSRRGTVTEFRETGTEWDVNFDAIDTEIKLWHGDNDTNVPIGDARRFAATASPIELKVIEETDHLQTLLRSVPEILNGYR